MLGRNYIAKRKSPDPEIAVPEETEEEEF